LKKILFACALVASFVNVASAQPVLTNQATLQLERLSTSLPDKGKALKELFPRYAELCGGAITPAALSAILQSGAYAFVVSVETVGGSFVDAESRLDQTPLPCAN